MAKNNRIPLFQGYSPGDNLLLPLLVAALSSIALVLLLALAVRRRKRSQIASSKLGVSNLTYCHIMFYWERTIVYYDQYIIVALAPTVDCGSSSWWQHQPVDGWKRWGRWRWGRGVSASLTHASRLFSSRQPQDASCTTLVHIVHSITTHILLCQ